MKKPETIELLTYGPVDVISFYVSKDWLIPVIEKYGFQSLEEFCSEYTWDLSFEVYREAQEDGEIPELQ